MLQLFRNFFKSKVGIVVTLAFLALIALAFASMDVANTGTFGGVTGGDRVAVVGDRRIDTSELSQNASNALEAARQEDPTITMEAFIARGGLEQVLDQLLTRNAIAEFGRRNGLRAGSRLVDSEIVQIPAFRGVGGNFDQDTFRAALQQRGLTEATVREDLAMGLYARQLVTPISFGTRLPQKAALRYARLLREERSGFIGAVPASAFAPEGDPTDAQLQAYYRENRDNYIRPERRTIRYAVFGQDALADLPAPTDAQIRERYQRDRAQYAASESRSFTQLVLPTQAAAQAIEEQVKGGTSLSAAAQGVGLATTQIPELTRAQLSSQTSAAVAAAGFQAPQGGLTAPQQGSLGWYVLRVDSIERSPERSLDQVRGEISTALAEEQRREALNEMTARIDDEFQSGSSLSDMARELGLEIRTTRPVTAAGQVYGTNEAAPEELARVLPVAFDMMESEPQIAETVPGEQFVVFDVSRITSSAPAPLAEIREDVIAAWRRDTGLERAGEAANRIMKRVRGGSTLVEAFAAEEVTLPRPEAANLSRQDIAQMQQVPPVLALYFSMAAGTVKRLENAQGAWMVVQLEDITAPDLEANDPLIAATRQQLGQSLGGEYAEQFVAAMEAEVGVERNQVAIDAVRAQLTGANN